MNAVLGWIKSNVVTVIFIVVMIAALIAVPLVATGMNKSVRERLNQRAGDLSKLEKLPKTSVDLPGSGSQTLLVNQKLLDRYLEVVGRQKADADQVVAAALEHNRKRRGVVLRDLFPEPPPARREVLRRDFYDQLYIKYGELMVEIDAGQPPLADELAVELESEEARFRNEVLQKDVAATLTPEEQAQLRDHLSQHRMDEYLRRADDVGMYASLDDFYLPYWDQQNQPGPFQLFEWQWQYWILEDVLRGLHDANIGSPSVHVAPVKRVVSAVVEPWTPPAPAAGAPVGATAMPIDPAREVKPDFSMTFTGRTTNPLYDVRYVMLDVIVSTQKLPAVIDSLAKQNFITVVDLDLFEVDPYAEIREGFHYGSEPVSRIKVLLETVWLREWTSEFMPAEVKQVLGIKDPPPAPTG